MEIRRWQYYFVVNCALAHCLLAKTFSLNEAIAAESQQKEALLTSPTKLEESEPNADRYPMTRKVFAPLTLKPKKNREIGFIFPRGKKISSFKYRKTFQIKAPLKPKKLRYDPLKKYKRKNQSVKREINGNEKLNQKYIPLLKNIGMLVDNILNSDTSESLEFNRRKRKRYYSGENSGDGCICNSKPDRTYDEMPLAEYETDTEQKTNSFASNTAEESAVTEGIPAAEVTTTTTDNPPISNISGFGQNKVLPILLPGNTISSRRNDHGFSERNSSAYNWGVERNISWYHGNNEYDTGNRKNKFDTQSYEENTFGTTRDDASSIEYRGRQRTVGNNTSNTERNIAIKIDEVSQVKTEDYLDGNGGYNDEYQRQNKFETGRHKIESTKLLSQPIRGLRGFLSEEVNSTEYLQSKEINEENNKKLFLSQNNTGYQRVANGSSEHAQKNQSVHPRDEGITLNPSNSTTGNKKTPVVIIIDGYSVARHKNGENKQANKAIRIHSQQ